MQQIHAPFGDAHALERGRSSLQFPAYAGAGLLERTRVFRDRVEASGGTIEDGALEDLYDPILRQVKKWGLLDDLVFFGAASAVKHNSRSIATLFDASGKEQDATQNTTSKQPTLDKNSIGGRLGAVFDGSDDEMINKSSIVASPATEFWVASLNTTPSYDYIVDGNIDNNISTRLIVRSNNGEWDIQNEYKLTDGAADQDDHLFEAVFDGANSELIIDGTSVIQGNTGTGSLEDMTIGSARGSAHWGGLINAGIILGSKLSSSQRSKIRSRIQDWYSL